MLRMLLFASVLFLTGAAKAETQTGLSHFCRIFSVTGLGTATQSGDVIMSASEGRWGASLLQVVPISLPAILCT